MFYKFPSTPYIMTADVVSGRKYLTQQETEELLANEVTIEEKIDGANLGISFDDGGNLCLQNRGEYVREPFGGQWKLLNSWLEVHLEELFELLEERYILFGEWCYACHTVKYDKLPDWFLAFDLYDKVESKFMSVARRDDALSRTTVKLVPKLGHGRWTQEELLNFPVESRVGTGQREGIYIRLDDDKWLIKRAKLVRSEFKQQMGGHWSSRTLVRNELLLKM